MPFTDDIDRRRFVKTLGAVSTVGALAGCNGDGGDDTPEPTEEPTPTATEEPTPTPTEEPTPTDTPEPADTPDDPVEAANAIIDELNNDPDGSVATLNDGLENVEGVEPIEPVENATAEEAARLREDLERLRTAIIKKVPQEINAQAGFELVSEDLEEISELRDEADRVEPVSAEAADALRRAADLADKIVEELNAAADQLESAES